MVLGSVLEFNVTDLIKPCSSMVKKFVKRSNEK